MDEKNFEVDKDDRIIGLRDKEEFFSGKFIHRSSHLLLFNSKNEILLQKRSINKIWYPGLYSFSVSGTVRDDTYKECIKKETEEELGIRIKPEFLFKFPFFDKQDKAWHSVFSCTYEGKIFPDGREMSEILWISQKVLEEDMRSNPDRYTGPFLEGMKIYFGRHYEKQAKK